MVQSDQGVVQYSGAAWDILSDLGALAGSIADNVGRDITLEACLMGIYGKSAADLEKIDDIMQAYGFQV